MKIPAFQTQTYFVKFSRGVIWCLPLIWEILVRTKCWKQGKAQGRESSRDYSRVVGTDRTSYAGPDWAQGKKKVIAVTLNWVGDTFLPQLQLCRMQLNTWSGIWEQEGGRCSELQTWKGDWSNQGTDITGEKWQRLKKIRNRFRANFWRVFTNLVWGWKLGSQVFPGLQNAL